MRCLEVVCPGGVLSWGSLNPSEGQCPAEPGYGVFHCLVLERLKSWRLIMFAKLS